MSMPLPNFFLAGHPKCGTTAFCEFLRHHPQVFMSSPKEPFYFCTDLHRESDEYHGRRAYFPVRAERDYIRLFDKVREESVIGEASTAYLFSRCALRNIRHVAPHAKILIILREPVDFLVSLHKQLLLAAHEDDTDFIGCLQRSVQCAEAARRANLPFPRSRDFREWIRYHEHLERCFQHFPRDQVKVLIFEEFRRDNAAAFREVAEWLGIDAAIEPKFRNVNKYGEGQLSPIGKYVFHPRLRALVRNVLPLRWHDPVWHFARRVFWREGSTPKTDKSRVREILYEEIRDAIDSTSGILGRNLWKVWGDRFTDKKREAGLGKSETGN